MFIVDIIFFVLITVGIAIGLKKGLIKQVGNIAAVVLGFVFSMKLYVPLANILLKWFTVETRVLLIISFVISFIVLTLLFLLAVLIVNRTVKNTPLVIIDKIGGALFALVIVLLICGVIIFSLSLVPFEGFADGIKNTISYKIVDFILTSPELKNVYTR